MVFCFKSFIVTVNHYPDNKISSHKTVHKNIHNSRNTTVYNNTDNNLVCHCVGMVSIALDILLAAESVEDM